MKKISESQAISLFRGLKSFLSTETVFSVLGDDVDTWCSGGCLLLATAIQRCFGGHLVGLWDGGVMHHVVVKFGDDCFVDCDGVSSVPQLLLRWEKQEGLIAPRLDQFSSHPDWFCPEDRVAVLSDLLTEFDKAIAIRA